MNNPDKDWNCLPPLRDVIARHDLRAEKKLGQNFLLDLNLTDKIAAGAGDLRGVTVFEIGPGPGGLTRSILKAGAKEVIAVEFDPRAIAALQDLVEFSGGRLQVLQADALDTDLLALAPEGERKIIANLPYNIATPLLIGWLRQIRADKNAFSSMTLMFQKEVADRIAAKAGSKAYGRLAVVSQWLCETSIHVKLPPQAFTPPPKVTSSVVNLVPRTLAGDEPPMDIVEAVTAAAFGQRRKMVRSSLKAYEAYLEPCGIDPTVRAEDLPPEAYIRLARTISE